MSDVKIVIAEESIYSYLKGVGQAANGDQIKAVAEKIRQNHTNHDMANTMIKRAITDIGIINLVKMQ